MRARTERDQESVEMARLHDALREQLRRPGTWIANDTHGYLYGIREIRRGVRWINGYMNILPMILVNRNDQEVWEEIPDWRRERHLYGDFGEFRGLGNIVQDRPMTERDLIGMMVALKAHDIRGEFTVQYEEAQHGLDHGTAATVATTTTERSVDTIVGEQLLDNEDDSETNSDNGHTN